ncbi:hypothetical protein CHUAL_007106 [Chamberlinius hualienensis]
MESLEFNPFFNALQGKFLSLFEEAQSKGFVVFVPSSNSLRNVVIDNEVVAIHLAKPSPYFQGEYIVYDGQKEKVIKIENNVVQRLSDFGDTSDIKIIGEEIGYSKTGNTFLIYIIDQPFQTFGVLEACSDRLKEADVSQSWVDGSGCPSVSQCKAFISGFNNGIILNELDRELETVLKNYLFLPNYLTEIADMLRKIIDSTIEKILRNELNLGPKTMTVLPICIEGYVLNAVHNVLFPIICSRFQQDDEHLSAKLSKLHQAGVTPCQLGAAELFSCPVPASIVELARLPSLTTAKEQLQCVKNTIDLISAEIKQHLLESRGFLSFTDALPNVTADDLIPALSTAVIKSKLKHLTANCYYMENFSWSVSSKDVYGYSLASFKAAIEFLKSFKTRLLLPSTSNLKKELSLEELMEVTGKIDSEKNKDGAMRESRPKSSVDRQMEKIAKMIEASTKELTQVQHKGFSGF